MLVDGTHTAIPFGKAPNGTAAQLDTLTNPISISATISTYGGMLTSLVVPDKAGKLGNVVLGFRKLDGYLGSAFRKSTPYFEALSLAYSTTSASLLRVAPSYYAFSLPARNKVTSQAS